MLFENLKEVEEKKATFGWIAEGRNRNSCHKELSGLMGRGLVREEPKDWERGQKKWYSLTEKGFKECARLLRKDITTCFKSFERFSSGLLSNPHPLNKALKMEAETSWKRISTKTENARDAIDELTLHLNDILRQPLAKIGSDLHKTLCYLWKNGSPPSEYVTIIRDNQVQLFKTRFLKESTKVIELLDLFISDSRKKPNSNSSDFET